ncbi:hypothetical protein [Rhodobacter maris]|uniref:Uncharacterized protein n=1 Tax=Rhodobacter maris TaxID=446682 RepID=A0A285SK88_9RHOB|nr:hypothetical protein [Rhodobacter maris]SOC06388.1 hypothetical protein SAMN05877831_1056 [Rhodobacter maris]
MVARYLGALMRAILVVIVIALPSMILPSVSADTGQVVTLVALFAAALTFFEYASVYPGLVEFRDAPPFNRIRYGALLAMVGMLSVVVLARFELSTFAQFVDALGAAMARVIDIPYSPLRLLVLMLPNDASPEQVTLLRTTGGVAFMIALATLGYFVGMIRALGWPMGGQSFNVWVNLPTFDPTAGGDVVERLRRDAWFNIALGTLLPFLVPAVIKLGSAGFAPVSLEAPQTLIWTVTAWAFLPTSLFMRGIAIGRVAEMIAQKRRAAEGGALQPV